MKGEIDDPKMIKPDNDSPGDNKQGPLPLISVMFVLMSTTLTYYNLNIHGFVSFLWCGTMELNEILKQHIKIS